MLRTVRSVGMVPSQTTATGVSASRPPRSSTSAMSGAFSTAIISTIVPRRLASAPHWTSESGCPGGRWPETMVRSWVTPRWVTGMPATAGTRERAADARDDRHRDARLLAGDDLLVAAAEDEVVAALEPGHPLAGAARPRR